MKSNENKQHKTRRSPMNGTIIINDNGVVLWFHLQSSYVFIHYTRSRSSPNRRFIGFSDVLIISLVIFGID